MKTLLKWSEGMQFHATSGEHTVPMDAKAPIGKDTAMTPKDLVLVGLGGCTAMDVVALLKKHKQTYESFEVEVEANLSKGSMPAVFTEATIHFRLNGNVDPTIFAESVKLSQTKYCGVSAMLAKAFPIHYYVHLNGEQIADGMASFNL